MTWNPKTWTTEIVTVPDLNAELRDRFMALVGPLQLFIPGSSLHPDLTNGCDVPIDQTLTAGRALLSGAGFSGTADQYAQFSVPFPKAWDASTLTFRVRWASTLAGAGDVKFSLAAVSASDGDAIDTAFGTAVTVTDTFLGTSKHHKTNASSALTMGATPAKEDMIYFRFGRLATDGSDTKAEKVWVEAVELFVTYDTVNDA
jgi:hypothetical protein